MPAKESRVNSTRPSASDAVKKFSGSLDSLSDYLLESPASYDHVALKSIQCAELVGEGSSVISEAVVSKETEEMMIMLINLATVTSNFQDTVLDLINSTYNPPAGLKKNLKSTDRLRSALADEQYQLRVALGIVPAQFTFTWTGEQQTYLADHESEMPIHALLARALADLEVPCDQYARLILLKRERNAAVHPTIFRAEVLKLVEQSSRVFGDDSVERRAVSAVVQAIGDTYQEGSGSSES